MRTQRTAPVLRRLLVATTGLLVLTTLVTSCQPSTSQLGFRLAPDGQHVEVLVNPCKRSRMHHIVVTREADPVKQSWAGKVTVWEVRSSKGRRLDMATIGVAPRGYQTVTALRQPLRLDGKYRVRFGEGGSSYGSFTPRQLLRSEVLFDDSYVSEEQYRKRAFTSCIQLLEDLQWALKVGVIVTLAVFTFAVIVGGTAVVLVIRARRSGTVAR